MVLTATALLAPPVRLPKQLCARGRILDELTSLDEKEEVAVAPKQVLEPETLFFEGPPSWTEVVLPFVSILTIIGIIPFLAALSRQLWVRYKITSRRISVQSGIGGKDFTEIIYPDIKDLKYVYRLGGAGDMVITLKDGAKLEMRAVSDFDNIYKYILTKIPETATYFTMK